MLRIVLPLLVCATLAACDAGLSGLPGDNQPPSTALSVRDTSLVENIGDDNRLASSVLVSWTGTDPDGFVVAFEVRSYADGQRPGPDAGWARTTRNDSLMLLPIERGERTANVTVEVRAIDNEGAKDPNPARTVFPVRNSPPTFSFNPFETPPETTFTVVTFAFTANDPEGRDNLDRIEVALNDSTNFIALPPETEFITLVGDFDRNDPSQTVTEARVFLGRGFQSTTLRVPGLRLDAENVLYARAVDQTDTTSAVQRYPARGQAASWYVKKPTTDVLVVNDYRKETNPTILAWHLALLEDYLGYRPDVWDVTLPYGTGSTGIQNRSPLLGTGQEPFLRETLALYSDIYWVTSASTNSAARNSLPFAAPAMSTFFENGGRLMVHSPITLPPSTDFQDNLDNPALFLLPISNLVPLDTVRIMRISRNAPIEPVAEVPGTGRTMPALAAAAIISTTAPYDAGDARTIPLLRAQFSYGTFARPSPLRTWAGPSVVASIRLDDTQQPQVGLMTLPIVDEQTGDPLITGSGGDPNATRDAVRLMLESLQFGRR